MLGESHDGSEGENSDRMPSAARLMKFCRFVRNAFARAAAVETTDFRMSPPLVRSSNRECFCLETSVSKPCHGMRLAARSQLKRKQGFLTPYAPVVLTLRGPSAAIPLG
jgi:hypothetical protein